MVSMMEKAMEVVELIRVSLTKMIIRKMILSRRK